MTVPLSTGLAAIVVLAAAGVALRHPWEASGDSEDAPTTLSRLGSGALDPPPAADMPARMTLPDSLPANHPTIQGATFPLPANHPTIDGTASPHDGMRGCRRWRHGLALTPHARSYASMDLHTH